MDCVSKTKVVNQIELERLTKEQTAYLTGPIVTQGSGWMSSLPSWIRNSMPEARLKHLLTSDDDDNRASRMDGLAVLFEVSLMTPIQSHFANIFINMGKSLSLEYLPGLDQWPMEAPELTTYEKSLERDFLIKVRSSIVKASLKLEKQSKSKNHETQPG